MTRRFQTLLALDLTIGLGSFPRERASVVQSFDGAPRQIPQWAGASEDRWSVRDVLSHRGDLVQQNHTNTSKRLRNRFDGGFFSMLAFTS